MKIAIHSKTGKFSPHWIRFCQEKKIEYKLVDVFDSDIIKQIEDCDVLMWHFSHLFYKDKILAQSILFSIELSGKVVFPDIRTSWHYDNKIAQKYLLEAIGAPFINSYVFTDKDVALSWANTTDYPKVFKLKGGAGATNVKLIRNKQQANKIIKKSFSKGFAQKRRNEELLIALKKIKFNRESLLNLARAFYNLIFNYTDELTKYIGNEKGYAYFQDFIMNNDYDTRLIVIDGNKAYGMQRKVREGDFRASGSKNFSYDPIPKSILEIAFNTAKTLKLQAVAFDFIFDNGVPKIIEFSFGFGTLGSGQCNGYWDDNYNWYETEFNPMGWIVESLLIKKSK